jgi:hypothetical protein
MSIVTLTTRTLLPIVLLTATLLSMHSCVVLKVNRDHKDIEFVKNNEHLYYEKALAAVTYAYKTGIQHIRTDSIHDTALRKKLQGLGSITVTFQENLNRTDEPIDSIVTFLETTVLLGWREVVYDFAARQRTFPDDKKDRSNYIFVKVADRLYYRRRPLPLM